MTEAYNDYYTEDYPKTIIRHKWAIETFLNNVKNKRILEIGCGSGGMIEYLMKTNEVYGADVSDSGIKIARRKGIKVFKVDISEQKLPFKTGVFDYVLMIGTIEHLMNPQKAINEVQRVLKKNGICLITAPNYRNEHHFIYPYLFRYWGFRNYLKNNGFKILRIKSYGICPPFYGLYSGFFRKIELDKNKKEVSMKIGNFVRFLSNRFFTFLKPYFLGWEWYFEVKNVDPNGSLKVFDKVAEGSVY